MKKLSLFAALFLFCFVVTAAQAQQLDAAFGFSAMTAPSSFSPASGHGFQTVGGGTFPTFSADVLFKHHLGFQGEVAFRAKQNLYEGYQPFRPIFYDFNAIWAPPLGKKMAAEMMGGIGSLSSRFYQSSYSCSFTGCTDYVSSNHLLGHVGFGLRYYVWNSVFIRPEAHFYFVRNNYEFSGPRVARYGISIGYTFGKE